MDELNVDLQYLDVSRRIDKNGVTQGNRTVFDAKFIPGAMIQHDLRNGFPAITTKKLAYNKSIAEIIGFIRGFDTTEQFESMGCDFWKSDANENKKWLASPWRKGRGDLGKVYGSTWRNREVIVRAVSEHEVAAYVSEGYVAENITDAGVTYLAKHFDMFRDCIDTIINNPEDRRIIFHAWFPELFPKMALPPCHVLYHFIPDKKNNVLHMCMYQRSCDFLLGVPMNIFGSALIQALVAEACGYTPGVFTHFLGNVHFYENQYEQAAIQRGREPRKLGNIVINKGVPDVITTDSAIEWLESVEPGDIEIIGYDPHPSLERVEMAQEK